MEKIKPKKERKFLKAMGNIALILLREIVLGIGKKVINKVGNKRQGLVIAFALVAGISYASIDSIPYPITGNKQRLGWQTSGNGLVYRGRSADTITKPSSYVDKNVKAYLLVDSVLGTIFVWRQTYWDSIKVNTRLMPFDSITFNTAKNSTVGVGEVEYNDTQGSLIQGLKGGNVTNVIGQQLHQRVNNRTGATLAKGTAVYLSGSQGNRITVAKALAISDPTSANTFGIVAESIDNNQSGYVITEGLITNINTSALVEDSAVYLSPTVAGGLTSTKPQAPQHNVYIGVCVKSNAGSGELFVSIKNGLEITELHDVQITSPVDRASLYYKSSEKLWRDTTAALLVSDTASMLANYSLKSYVDSIAQNFQDSIDEITNGYFKQEFPTVTKDTLNWTKPVQLPVGGSNLLLVYRNGQMINDAQYSVIDTNKVKINSGSYKLGENYTVVYVKGGGGSGSGGVPFDTSVLNLQARLDLKLNISDTAAMLANYATKAYADTTGRFYARQDFTNVSSSTLTWNQSDTLVTGGVNVVQVYRNGQILLPSQYTIPSSTSVVISATSYKAGENYTVIFPRGGGAGSSGGSGSLTSISAGTGITVSPNPITTTGTVSANLSVLMELTDTSLLNLTSRFATKQNTLVSGTNIKTVNSNSLLGSGNISVGTLVGADTVSLSNRINTKLTATDTASLSSRINLKLTATDTASLSNRIDAKGTGTVTSVGSGYGLLSTQSPITTSGVIRVDSNTVYNYVRDSIVKVRIGNDTIKILKQEYNNVTTDTLTWTTTKKFPIQLRAYILLFRNGQLLINDQYSIIDTNKVKVAATSYKVGENYTLVTVSGIGSAGVSQTGNFIYPEAGIALSTGTTWTTSIPNNSSNWNTAFTDRLKWDGGSSGLVAATGRTSLGGTTIGQSMFTLTNPSAITFPRFNADNTVEARSAANFRSDIGAGTVTSVNVAAGTPMSITNNTTTPEISMAAATGSINGYLTSIDWNTFNNKQNALSNASSTVSGILTSTDWNTFNNKQNALSNASSTVSGILTSTDWNTFNNKQTAIAFAPPLQNQSNVVTISQASSTNNGYLSIADWNTFNNKFNTADTTQLNLTSRFNTKQNTLSGTGFIKANGTSITYDNSSYLRTGLADSTYLKLTGGTLSGNLYGINQGLSTNLTISDIIPNNPPPIYTSVTTGPSTSATVKFGLNVNNSGSANMFLGGTQIGGGNGTNPNIFFTDTRRAYASIQGIYTGAGITSSGHIAFNTTPNDNTTALTERMRIASDGAITMGGTLGVTGAATLGSTLAVTGNITEAGNNVLTSADTTSMLTPYFRDADTTQLNLTSRFNTKQNTLTNPVTGTGTNNFIPKFTSTGSTIGNSTIQDNGTTVSTSSILSTTNYASFNTTQVMSNSSGILSTHRFTSANANGVYDKDFFLTSYMGAPWQGSDIGSGNRSKPPIVAIVNNNDPSFINSGLHLMTTNSTNNTYTPAITFGVNSENGSYYNTIGAITAKKLNTGNYTSQSAGQLEFFGTGTALDATGASMTTANMTLGVGVGIGYTTAPTVRGRLIVSEKLGINQSTPNFTLDVSGTANITGAATLGSTLAVTGATTLSTTTATPSTLLGKDGSNVVGTVTLGNTLNLTSGTLNVNNKITDINTSTYSITSTDYYIDNKNSSSTTIILPLAGLNTFRELKFKNSSTGSLIANGNIIPLSGSGTTTTILPATNAKWCTLVSDGTDWRIMQAN